MSASQAKHDTAEALYEAIKNEVATVGKYGSPAEILERLAHAYSLVAQTPAPDPEKRARVSR